MTSGNTAHARTEPQGSIATFLETIAFAHTIFALPFALGALWVAARGWPGWQLLGLVLGAMLTARTCAMLVNRLVDHTIDARNPRTAHRPLVRGALSIRTAWIATAISAVLFLAICAAINPLAFTLAPIALCVLCGYSFLKRVTPWCHLGVGVALGLTPLAAEVAATQAITLPFVVLGLGVSLWVAGFDMLYALQDQDFDRREGLHSIPARFGTVRAIMIARGLHVGAILALAIFGISAHLATLYFLGVATITGLLTWEHRLVTPQDLTRIDAAFFTANGWISMVFFMATLLGLPTPRL